MGACGTSERLCVCIRMCACRMGNHSSIFNHFSWAFNYKSAVGPESERCVSVHPSIWCSGINIKHVKKSTTRLQDTLEYIIQINNFWIDKSKISVLPDQFAVGPSTFNITIICDFIKYEMLNPERRATGWGSHNLKRTSLPYSLNCACCVCGVWYLIAIVQYMML